MDSSPDHSQLLRSPAVLGNEQWRMKNEKWKMKSERDMFHCSLFCIHCLFYFVPLLNGCLRRYWFLIERSAWKLRILFVHPLGIGRVLRSVLQTQMLFRRQRFFQWIVNKEWWISAVLQTVLFSPVSLSWNLTISFFISLFIIHCLSLRLHLTSRRWLIRAAGVQED